MDLGLQAERGDVPPKLVILFIVCDMIGDGETDGQPVRRVEEVCDGIAVFRQNRAFAA